MKMLLLILILIFPVTATSTVSTIAPLDAVPAYVDFSVSITYLFRGTHYGVAEINQVGGNADRVRIQYQKDKATTIIVDRGAPDIILSEPWSGQVKLAIERLQKGK